jgi:hypothetical protein
MALLTGRIPERYAGRPLAGDGLLGAGAFEIPWDQPALRKGRRVSPAWPNWATRGSGGGSRSGRAGCEAGKNQPATSSGVIDTPVFRVLPRGKNLKENNCRRAKMAPPEAFRGWILPAKKVSKIKGRKGGGANDAVLLDLVGLTRTGQPHAAPG